MKVVDYFYQDGAFNLKLSFPTVSINWEHLNFLQKQKPLDIVDDNSLYCLYITYGYIKGSDLHSLQDLLGDYTDNKLFFPYDLPQSIFKSININNLFHLNNVVFNNSLNLHYYVINNKISFLLFLNCKNEEEFISILDNKLYLFIENIKKIWLLFYNGFKIHSSAVNINNGGYIFLGKSRAGKSTAAELSISHSGILINTDQNFIYFNQKNGYLVSPPKDLSNYTNVIAFFNLIQSNHNSLEILNKLYATKVIFQAFLQNVTHLTNYSDRFIELGFHNASKIANLVPVYDLYFTKTTKFLDILKAEFPDAF